MYKIREAVLEDWPHVWRMAQQFFKLTNYPGNIHIDEASTYESFEKALNTGFVLLGTFEEVPIAMIGVYITPFILNSNVLQGTEVMWWVDEKHRGSSLASHLHSHAENKAHDAGCTMFVMSALANSPAVVNKYYEAQGYVQCEAAWAKEI